MDDHFDPYHKWLGIPPADQPPDHYRLLGLSAFEDDPAVIESSADRQMTHVRTFQAGRHGAHSQRLLNEIAAARLCLLKPERKAQYDRELRARQSAALAPIAAPHVAAPPRAASPAAVPIAAVVPRPIEQPIVPIPPVVGVVPLVKPAGKSPTMRPRRKPPHMPMVATAVVLAIVAGVLIVNQQSKPDPPRMTVSVAPAGESTGVPRSDDQSRTEPSDKPDSGQVASPASTTATPGRPSPGSSASDRSSADPASSPAQSSSAANRPATVTPSSNRPGSTRPKPATTTPTSKPTPAKPSPEPTEPPAPTVTLPTTTRTTPTRKESPAKRPRNVHKEAIEHDGNWYLFSNEKVGFAEALANAARLKGRLVVISTAGENAFVTSMIKGPTFLGLVKQNDQWMNSLEKPQQYFNWDRGQPQASRPREVFAAIHPNGRWHDYLPDKLYFCVEWGTETP